jgi:hypothetical protein
MAESSLRELDRVEDRIRLQRQGDQRPVLVIEGPDDELVLRTHFPESVMFVAAGRKNVIAAALALKSWGVRNVLSLVDLDYLGKPPKPVKTYTGRDLEGMLVSLGGLHEMLEFQGSGTKIALVGGVDEMVGLVKSDAAFLSCLRAVNAQNNLGLPFDSVDVWRKVDLDRLQFDHRVYCQALLAKCNCELSVEELIALVAEAEDDGHGPSGKDVVALAGVSLRRLIGDAPHAVTHPDFLLPQLRMSSALALRGSEWLRQMRASLLSGIEARYPIDLPQ